MALFFPFGVTVRQLCLRTHTLQPSSTLSSEYVARDKILCAESYSNFNRRGD